MTTDHVTTIEEPAPMTTEPTPTERRGYPLPPWALEARYPNGAEVLEYLVGLCVDEDDEDDEVKPGGAEQAEAYLDAITTARADAQAAASRCLVEGHEDAVTELADTFRKAGHLAARVNELERDVARQTEAYRALEELYVATHRPPVQLRAELDEDDERYDVATIRLAYDRLGADALGLDTEACQRIAEAAGTAAHVAYERELAAARIVRTGAEEPGGVAERGRC